MKKFTLMVVVATGILSGCATNDYKLYAETQQKIAQAQAQAHAVAEAARYAALAEIAKNGDATSRVAAAMSLSLGNNGNNQSIMRPVPINPPVSFTDRALQWTGVLLPSVTSLYGINANRQVAITQSNNQAAVATSTNNTFASMNSNMATSNTAIANSGLAAATTIANSGLTAVTTTAANGLTATTNVATAGINGVVTSGANGLTAATAISNSANTAITNVSNAANTSIQTLSNQLPNLQPNITTTTTTTTTNNNNLTCPVGKTMVNGSCV